MRLTKECKWFCEHASQLEKFSGEWVMFRVEEGIVCHGPTLNSVMNTVRKMKRNLTKPYIFHVPSREELSVPMSPVKTT